jgi:hypothetical protein
MMMTKVLNPTSNSLHRRQKGVASFTMGDTLVAITILLSSKIQVDANGRAERGSINERTINSCSAGDFKGSVTEAERVTVPAVVRMLTGTEQVEVTNKKQVTNSGLDRVRRAERVDRMAGQGQWDGFDPHRRGVTGAPRPLHLLEGRDNVARDT